MFRWEYSIVYIFNFTELALFVMKDEEGNESWNDDLDHNHNHFGLMSFALKVHFTRTTCWEHYQISMRTDFAVLRSVLYSLNDDFMCCIQRGNR